MEKDVMRELLITKQTEGGKLLRTLYKIMPKAGNSFLHKMLRKKNITINNSKADGSEILKDGDLVKIFFSEETFENFGWLTGNINKDLKKDLYKKELKDKRKTFTLDIIFENDDIILVNKPIGILSQKADEGDISMVELITYHLESKVGTYKVENPLFKPAVANRLDRNTSGIIAAGKTVKGLKFLSDGFKKRKFDKLYLTVARGKIEEKTLLNGLWSKDSHGNKVRIKDIGWKPEMGRSFPKEYWVEGNVPVQTAVYPIKSNKDATVLMVELLTGKTHQIRAQLSGAGHPLLADYKYGNKGFNDIYKKKYGIESQFLHAYYLSIPGIGSFFADIPASFTRILKGENLWEPGIQEVFEDQHLRI